MMKLTIFCDTEKSAKKYAHSLYKYYIGIYNMSKDGEQYKPMIERGLTKIFLPTADDDILLIDFVDYIDEKHFTSELGKINNFWSVWRDRTLTGSKQSLCDLATMIAEIYFKIKTEEF